LAELLAVTVPGKRELALAFVVLGLIGAALFGPQVAGGGFYWDDWQNAANTHFSLEPGLFGALDRATERPVFAYRPVLTTLLVFEHKAFGDHVWLHIALAVLFGVLVAWSLYLLLRTVGFGRLDSGAPAALLLAFPWVDSTRFWATASYDALAVALYLCGLTLAVRGLRERRRWMTIASLILYLAASWTYEIVIVGVLASVAVYLAVAPRRDALRRFGLDALLAALALALVASGTTRDPQSLGDQVDHAGRIASQSFSLLARALVPVGEVPGLVGALVLAGLAALAWRRGVDRWLVTAALGALFVAAGYALFIPALPHYLPLEPGTTNRMNVLAAVGFVVLVYALVRTLAGPRTWLVLVAWALIGAGYVVKVAGDEGDWRRSARLQQQVLASLPVFAPTGTTFYTFGAPTFAAAGVPVFSLPFDLRAAVRLRFDNASLAAYPLAERSGLSCGRLGLHPTGGSYGPAQTEEYGHAVLVDVPRRRAIPIDDRADCLRWQARVGG
jgi:hypothetical protein